MCSGSEYVRRLSLPTLHAFHRDSLIKLPIRIHRENKFLELRGLIPPRSNINAWAHIDALVTLCMREVVYKTWSDEADSTPEAWSLQHVTNDHSNGKTLKLVCMRETKKRTSARQRRLSPSELQNYKVKSGALHAVREVSEELRHCSSLRSLRYKPASCASNGVLLGS